MVIFSTARGQICLEAVVGYLKLEIGLIGFSILE